MTEGPLGDLAVVDFSRVLAGPFATMVLADFGATVTKVERPGVGDETRAWGPPWDAGGQATYFQSVNRNKHSVTLDLSLPRDLERATEMARGADVVVENFRPGVMDRLGLSYDTLRALNPALVYCSITAFGRGEGATIPGYDLLVQAVGGLMSITGPPDGEPQKVGVALVDVLAGLFASVGILTALRHRQATGEGQLVEVNLLMSLLASLVNQGSAYSVAGVLPERMGNRHPSIAPYELLHTLDGELVVAVGNDRQFAALCDVIGAPGLAGERRFAANADRVAHRDELRELLTELLRPRSAAQWVTALLHRGVPAGVVNDVGEAFTLATRLGLAPLVDLVSPDGGAIPLTRSPIELSCTPATYRSAPPPLGG
jgi:crotonobetainyl-CoA:carnitine CoA-transferase CaiB-like acyl-CoA transferase